MTDKTKAILFGLIRIALLLASLFCFSAAVSVFLFHLPFYHGFPVAVATLITTPLIRKYVLVRER